MSEYLKCIGRGEGWGWGWGGGREAWSDPGETIFIHGKGACTDGQSVYRERWDAALIKVKMTFVVCKDIWEV